MLNKMKVSINGMKQPVTEDSDDIIVKKIVELHNRVEAKWTELFNSNAKIPVIFFNFKSITERTVNLTIRIPSSSKKDIVLGDVTNLLTDQSNTHLESLSNFIMFSITHHPQYNPQRTNPFKQKQPIPVV